MFNTKSGSPRGRNVAGDGGVAAQFVADPAIVQPRPYVIDEQEELERVTSSHKRKNDNNPAKSEVC